MITEAMTILVSSCDAFSDCWAPFLYAMHQVWPDCPYQVCIISNTKPVEGGILVGEDKHWGSNLQKALLSIDDDYILYLQEDYWLTTPVSNSFISEQLQYCKSKGLDCLRITFPWMDKYKIDDLHALSPESEPYAVCLQAAIWKKSSLENVVKDGMTGWVFEDLFNTHKDHLNLKVEVLLESVSRKQFHYVDAVRKGRWTQIGIKWLKRNGFSDLVSSREKEGVFYTAVSRMAALGPAKRANRLMLAFLNKKHLYRY